MKTEKNAIEPGTRFGRLITIHRYPGSEKSKISHSCLCDCGNTVVIAKYSLLNGQTKSCGCLQKERVKERFTKHGRYKTPTYMTWDGMVQRTTNPRNSSYPNYGGRGITLDPKWKSFEGFIADMGERPPNTQLDRIDNSLGYYKGNCRWVSRTTQNRNKRNSIYVEWNGERRLLRELADEYNIPRRALYMRVVSMGWDLNRALSTPIQKKAI